MSPPRRVPLGISGLILATLATIVVLSLEGHPTEGGYCTKSGIGADDRIAAADGPVIYVSAGWGGFPPGERCAVYGVDYTSAPSPRIEGAMSEAVYEREGLDTLPRNELAAGTYPGKDEWAWIAIVLLIPPLLWALYALTDRRRGRRPT